MTAQPPLQAALAAEHAAIFGYGALGPHLTGQAARARAAEAEQIHRDHRNDVAALLIKAKVEPVAAEPAYALPFPVEDRASAMKLAVQLEERTAAAWRAVVPEVTEADRTHRRRGAHGLRSPGHPLAACAGAERTGHGAVPRGVTESGAGPPIPGKAGPASREGRSASRARGLARHANARSAHHRPAGRVHHRSVGLVCALKRYAA